VAGISTARKMLENWEDNRVAAKEALERGW
jgi:hypothetical protein